ncbi:MAG: TraR/DksA C4-type zinc finger protein [Actinomycetota bacterium]|jgi:DnaK suppressor protein|nr:TraR/DksA C4-type zinc finger protein [Actinomycetota bacterium]
MANETPTAKRPPKRLVTALRARLETERGELAAQASELEADFADQSWRDSRFDDEAETGSATFERERTMSLARNARQVILDIDRALERIDAGTYGVCVSCASPIAHERLEAVPQTVHCVDCRRRAERFR